MKQTLKNLDMSPFLQVLSFKVIDAGLFLTATGTIRNKLTVPVPMVRLQVEIRNNDGKVIGHQIEEVAGFRPMQTRKFEFHINHADAKNCRIIRMAPFEN